MKTKPCPKCGKPMVEQAKFPGLWTCPDYDSPINDAPPYKYKCTGMHLTKKGSAQMTQALNKHSAELN